MNAQALEKRMALHSGFSPYARFGCRSSTKRSSGATRRVCGALVWRWLLGFIAFETYDAAFVENYCLKNFADLKNLFFKDFYVLKTLTFDDLKNLYNELFSVGWMGNAFYR